MKILQLILILAFSNTFAQTKEIENLTSLGGTWKKETLLYQNNLSYIVIKDNVFVFNSNGTFTEYLTEYKYNFIIGNPLELQNKFDKKLMGTWVIINNKLTLKYLESMNEPFSENKEWILSIDKIESKEAVLFYRMENGKKVKLNLLKL